MKRKRKLIVGLKVLALTLSLSLPGFVEKKDENFLLVKSFASQNVDQEIQKAQEKRDKALKDYEENAKNLENVLGFYDWVKESYPQDTEDVDKAISILKQFPKNTSYTDKKDATSMENIKRSLEILEESSKLRTQDKNFKNLPPFVTGHATMAMAISNANNSYRYENGHLKHFFVGENLSWGSENPNQGWYWNELEIYNNKGNGVVGHYTNVVRKAHFASAIGLNEKAGSDYGRTWSQVFILEGTGEDKNYYSINDYIKLIKEYENHIKENPYYKAYQKAEADYQKLLNENKGYKTQRERMEGLIVSLEEKINGLEMLKEVMPQTYQRYQSEIEKAIKSANDSIKVAKSYLENN